MVRRGYYCTPLPPSCEALNKHSWLGGPADASLPQEVLVTEPALVAVVAGEGAVTVLTVMMLSVRNSIRQKDGVWMDVALVSNFNPDACSELPPSGDKKRLKRPSGDHSSSQRWRLLLTRGKWPRWSPTPTAQGAVLGSQGIANIDFPFALVPTSLIDTKLL